MKVSALITKLTKLKVVEGDVEVVIDNDENGYYDVEALEIRAIDGEMYVNIKSSNEA